MRNYRAGAALCGVLAMGAAGYTAFGTVLKSSSGTERSDASPAVTKLDSGVVLVAELSKSLNARKLHPGDKVAARVIQDLVVHGKVVIPRGSKLIGNVTEIKTRSKED